jgi:hypothetical protein
MALTCLAPMTGPVTVVGALACAPTGSSAFAAFAPATPGTVAPAAGTVAPTVAFTAVAPFAAMAPFAAVAAFPAFAVMAPFAAVAAFLAFAAMAAFVAMFFFLAPAFFARFFGGFFTWAFVGEPGTIAMDARWFVLVEARAAPPTDAAGERQRAAGTECDKPRGEERGEALTLEKHPAPRGRGGTGCAHRTQLHSI